MGAVGSEVSDAAGGGGASAGTSETVTEVLLVKVEGADSDGVVEGEAYNAIPGRNGVVEGAGWAGGAGGGAGVVTAVELLLLLLVGTAWTAEFDGRSGDA